jgi:phytoene synthase
VTEASARVLVEEPRGGREPRAVAAAPAREARATIAHHSKSFALASRLLDRRVRDQTAVVYTFCRRADDAVDLAPGDPAAALARLRAEVDAIYAGTATDDVLAAFAAIAQERAIPRRYPDELIAGMAMDVAGARYATFADLHLYCYRVAGVVGLMMCQIFGLRDDAALVPAARLGVAMQLTNICRDVAEDWARGRLYLPDELLAEHGLGGLASELGRPLPRSARAGLAACVRVLLGRAARHYHAADAGVPALPWRAALAVRAARSIYAAIGDVLIRRGCDVLAPRAVVSRAHKLRLVALSAARTLGAARLGAPPVRIPARILEASDVPVA